MSKRKQPTAKPPQAAAAMPAPVTKGYVPHLPYIILFIVSCLVYGNTLLNDYAIDDTMVVTDNEFTKKGFAGIKDHFTHDGFEGFFGERGAKLVSGGRYRPLSMATFSLEYGIFNGLNPAFSHAVNVLLFALTCCLVYYLLSLLIPVSNKSSGLFDALFNVPFLTALLFAVHPIHTEAVSNIKGRDEVMAMLFALLAMLACVWYVRSQKWFHLLWGSAVFFLALLSKENAITFLAVVPLTYFVFTKAKSKHYLLATASLLVPSLVFLYIRSQFTQTSVTDTSPEVLNNPFLYATTAQRYATTILTFLYYYKLLLLPHPLTHDYYYNQIPYVSFGEPLVWLSVVATLALVIYALLKLKEKSVVAFGILFYFITFSIVSNVLFTVGVLMNERFMYMSSLGFCVAVAWMLVHAYRHQQVPRNLLAGILSAVLVLFSVKTFTRNFDWKDNFTLFMRDVRWSPNSAKIQTSCGGDLTKEADRVATDTFQRNKLLLEAIEHLNQAIKVYPNHSNAWLLLGNAKYKLNKNPQEAIEIYTHAKQLRVGGYFDASFNLGCVLAEQKMFAEAIPNFLEADALKPGRYECLYNLGDSYMNTGKGDSAIFWFKKALEVKPDDPFSTYGIGKSYGRLLNDLPNAIIWLKKATELNPKAEVYWEDLGVAYGLMGQTDNAIAAMQQLIAANPNYPAAYFNLSVSYKLKGDLAKANEYLNKAKELAPQAYGSITVK